MSDPTLSTATPEQIFAALVERKILNPSTARALASRSSDELARCISDGALIGALEGRDRISWDEAEALRDGDRLEDFYARRLGLPENEVVDGTAYDRASAAIRYGDLSEALLQTSRILPGLDRLADLAARNAKGA